MMQTAALLLLLLLILPSATTADSTTSTQQHTHHHRQTAEPVVVACSTDADCHTAVSSLSVCLSSTGSCSQPHQNTLEQGCLRAKVPGWNQLRTCNSDDVLPEAAEMGLCQPASPQLDYLEIRIKCQDWESVIFGSWILQIILSEILQVPTTLETGTATSVMQLYDTADRFEFGTTSNNLQAFRNAHELAQGDCRKLQQPQNESTYLNCAHVIPEVWTAKSEQVNEYIRQDILDPPLSLGALGIEGWYIPKYTAETDPTLTSWIGMQGPHNRHKLASMFPRPTKWQDYCNNHSPTNCTAPDGVARRPPANDREASRLYAGDDFVGFFRNTTHNNCIDRPHNCTGHIGDFPCGWGGSLEAQCYHLDIGLESNGDEPYSGGYTYSQLGQMWRAANATRNHVAMMWAIPDPIYEEFQGTDYEFVKVTLPAATQTCQENRINAEHRCVPDHALRVGPLEGVCDETARPLHKLMLKEMFELTQGAGVPKARHSPAHSVVSQFSLTELQINEMFKYWQTVDSSSWTPREAICQWAVDNLDHLTQYIPRTYPRTVETSSNQALFISTIILGTLATLMVVATTFFVYTNRSRRVFRYAQIEFLYLLLAGAAAVGVGAILTGLQQHSTNVTCVSQIWLLGLGYTLTLVPLLVKVAAINRLMQAAQHMRRVELTRTTLREGVALIALLVAAYLLLWTIVDAPHPEADFELTDEVMKGGADDSSLLQIDSQVVQVRYYCTSDSDFWQYVAVSWNLVLIICATALAFQSRSVKSDFNEARELSRLIYSHFIFVLLRLMSFFFDPWVGNPMQSIIYSLDTITMLLVYFSPKFLAGDVDGRSNHTSALSSQRIDGSRVRVSGLSGNTLNQVSHYDTSSHHETSSHFFMERIREEEEGYNTNSSKDESGHPNSVVTKDTTKEEEEEARGGEYRTAEPPSSSSERTTVDDGGIVDVLNDEKLDREQSPRHVADLPSTPSEAPGTPPNRNLGVGSIVDNATMSPQATTQTQIGKTGEDGVPPDEGS